MRNATAYWIIAVMCATAVGFVYGHIQEAQYWDGKMKAVQLEYENLKAKTDEENAKRINNLQTVTAASVKRQEAIKRKFNDYVAVVDRMHADSTGGKASVPDSSAVARRNERASKCGCTRQSDADLRKLALVFARERDECAVKFNSILELYKGVQDGR